MSDVRSDVRRLRSAALKWYDTHGRALPWRTSADPYRVWLSEIMLQQTTVAAVIPYYERFIASFPSVSTLASARVERVLRLWEGLGYYSRARNLHSAAQVVMRDFGGVIPSGLDQLQSLPGIGRYTAGAIRSFAFDLPAPILEANTERLFARLLALRDDVRSAAGKKRLWAFAESLTSTHRSGDLNQAWMDVGSQVCRPVAPDCERCPFRSQCRAFIEGCQSEVPVRSRGPSVTQLFEVCVVFRNRDRYRVHQRGAEERWAGMWDFPRLAVSDALGNKLTAAHDTKAHRSGRRKQSPSSQRFLFPLESSRFPSELEAVILEQTGLRPGAIRSLHRLSYIVTRYRIDVLCIECDTADTGKPVRGRRWVSAEQLRDLPLPQNARRIADRIVG